MKAINTAKANPIGSEKPTHWPAGPITLPQLPLQVATFVSTIISTIHSLCGGWVRFNLFPSSISSLHVGLIVCLRNLGINMNLIQHKCKRQMVCIFTLLFYGWVASPWQNISVFQMPIRTYYYNHIYSF